MLETLKIKMLFTFPFYLLPERLGDFLEPLREFFLEPLREFFLERLEEPLLERLGDCLLELLEDPLLERLGDCLLERLGEGVLERLVSGVFIVDSICGVCTFSVLKLTAQLRQQLKRLNKLP